MTSTNTRRVRSAGSLVSPSPYRALLCLLVLAILTTSLLTFSPLDWPNPHVYPTSDEPRNACGKAGAWLAFHAVRLLGAGCYPLLIFGTLGTLLWIKRGRLQDWGQRVAGLLVMATVTSTVIHLLRPEGVPNLPGGYGGILGRLLGSVMHDYFSGAGTVLILSYCALAACLFMIDGFWTGIARSVVGITNRGRRALSATTAVAAAVAGRAESALAVPAEREAAPASRTRRQPARAEELPSDGEPPAPGQKVRIEQGSTSAEQAESADCYPAVLDDWVLPPIGLLEDVGTASSSELEKTAREKARTLESTLRDYRIEAPVVAIETGPVVTMYELQLAAGVKVSQIMALANDIARALKAPAVRIVATMAGKSTVGVEVPRMDRERVRLRELMAVTGKTAQRMSLPLFLGKDASGRPMVYDLTRMPHLLIAGTTGSGKSVCINSIIMSLLMTQRPDHAKLILIDPKMVELNAFRDVPHLMCPIVTDMNKAENILEWACGKMEERYATLAEAGVRHIADYNRLGKEELLERLRPANEAEAAQIPTRLPYMVIVIDELADLMMTSAREVEHHLARLAQKSRAVGIHIVVATQRPEARVVTGLIKSNMPCRCGFRVAARMDSRIVLDQNGAEVLLGQGDMLFLPPGSARLVRAQGTYIDDAEIRRTTADLQSKGASIFHPELVKISSATPSEVGDRDPLFDEAVCIILETQRGSVSLLQRRLTIGYSRASRLVDQMAEAGIVGQYKGSQAREVLMTADEWEELQRLGAATADLLNAADADES